MTRSSLMLMALLLGPATAKAAPAPVPRTTPIPMNKSRLCQLSWCSVICVSIPFGKSHAVKKICEPGVKSLAPVLIYPVSLKFRSPEHLCLGETVILQGRSFNQSLAILQVHILQAPQVNGHDVLRTAVFSG